MPLECNELADILLFADDAKISKNIIDINDKNNLQVALSSVTRWLSMWLLSLNIIKCLTLNIRRINGDINEYYITTGKGDEILKNVKSTKDLGVIIDNKLTFKEHITDKIKKANTMLGLIKRNFRYLDEKTFLLLYKSLVRSQLEYASCIWYPYKLGLIDIIESVQKRATKLIHKLKNVPYNDRLKILKLPTLTYRRYRGM